MINRGMGDEEAGVVLVVCRCLLIDAFHNREQRRRKFGVSMTTRRIVTEGGTGGWIQSPFWGWFERTGIPGGGHQGLIRSAEGYRLSATSGHTGRGTVETVRLMDPMRTRKRKKKKPSPLSIIYICIRIVSTAHTALHGNRIRDVTVIRHLRE
jgi:hypothetical protein